MTTQDFLPESSLFVCFIGKNNHTINNDREAFIL